MWRRVLVVVFLLAGCSGAPPPAPVADTGHLEGLVLDALLRPIPDARVTVDGVTVRTGEDGTFRLDRNWTLGDHIIVVSAEGYIPTSHAIEATNRAQTFDVRITLSPVPVGFLDTQVYDGLVACGIIAQVGHSHGNGDPDEDNHIDCAMGSRGQQTFELIPDPGVDDLLLELFWEPGSDYAQRMTMVLRDDEGEVVTFDEGGSPLRVEFGQAQIQQVFEGGRTATIQVLPGIPSNAPGEVYIGMHIEQPFRVFATTGHGIEVPMAYSVAG